MRKIDLLCRKNILTIALIGAVFVMLLAGCSGKGSLAPAGSGTESPSAAASADAGSETAAVSAAPTKAPEASVAPSAAKPEATAPAPAANEAATAEASPPDSTGAPAPTPAPTATPAPTETPKGTAVEGWVTGIPEYVPKFNYGKLDLAASKIVEGSVSSVFNLCFRGVGKADMDAYASLLKDGGFVVAVAEIGNTYTLTASLDRDRDTATLVVTLSETDSIAIFALGAPV